LPDSPIFFIKPDTALLRNNQPFYHPSFSDDIHYEVEVVLRVCKEGKSINSKFALDYFDEIGVGIDFTARDIQSKLKAKGLPWEEAKGFDNSAPVGHFVSKTKFLDLNDLAFGLKVNDKKVQSGNTRDMIFSFEKIISYVSKFITLKKGDLIFTGTPSGVGKVNIGDGLVADLDGEVLLDFEVK